MKTGKKRSVIAKIGGAVLIFFAVLLAAFCVWALYCVLDTYDPVNALPEPFAAYVQTDSIRQAAEPLLDLQAADLVLATPEFSGFRESFINLRASGLRRNFFVKRILSRRVDAALYTENGAEPRYIAVIKMDLLSTLTRISHFAAPFLNVPGLVYVSSASYSGFEYRTDAGTFFVKPMKNLLVVTTDRELLQQSLASLETGTANRQAQTVLESQAANPIRIAVNAENLFNLFPQDNPLLAKLRAYIPAESFGTVSFGITDEEIRLNIQVPFANPEPGDPFEPILTTPSALPAVLQRLPESTQYYTLLNAGTLEQIKNAAVPFLPDALRFDSLWSNADSMCRFLFSIPLEQLIFSWTGKEIGVLGLEGKNDPVFVLQIKDEQRRQEIFNTFLSSIIIQNGNSLIYDGVRIPCLQIPQFFQNLLSVFGVKLPRPYYLIQDGFIYFSESPENLSEIYTARSRNAHILKNKNWTDVSASAPTEISASLFYDLERSLPFFARGKSLPSDIFRLYNIGRCDVNVKNGIIACSLTAQAKRNPAGTLVHGYPMQLEGAPDPALILTESKGSSRVYWIEDGTNVQQLDTKTLRRTTYVLPEKSFLVKSEAAGSEVWAVTAQGAVYLLNGELQPVPGFPVLTGETPKADGSVLNGSLVFPAAGNLLCSVSPSGTVAKIAVPATGSLMSKPTVLGARAAVYAKGFTGELFHLNANGEPAPGEPLKVNGIAFGSPALADIGGAQYTAFVTQAGTFYLWKNGIPADGFPIKLDGVFYTNVQAGGPYFYALSADATVHRVDTGGGVLSVTVPNYKAKSGTLTVTDCNDDGTAEVFVSPDGSVVYGFTADLELLPSFPRPGWGRPVFTDTTGDKKREMIVLTADKKLTAWKIAQ
ncbi:hypothetical protein [Treponema brennaborense]|uniref:Uncharacterized protein n=1 Tax=Treponema brennaborense (strain DSM 12168 / CIP 105900 / DD5/3) TaxID=906968 RepID=F4LNZ5_TREBD|nr:hypothetical protein [Treponema brennaborense]AEE17972.1 hypothetical protein Trebr_2568 [Treponema brennaborense DSM 12168]